MARTGAHLQILANYAASACEAMAYTLMRTAHSTFVKETEDFSCGLLTPDGLTFASPKGLGATWYTGLDYGPVIAAIVDYEDGDICITNDPYSGFVATHTPDIHIWKPVFHRGELVCFVAGHIHNTDMGGAVPASLSRTLTEVHQEGVRIPPAKLVRAGQLDRTILEILRVNVRVPGQNWGDLNAQIASVNTGERRVHEMIERFGIEGFRRGMLELLDYAEAQARAIVAKIPDGDYRFSEFADEDSDGGYPCRVTLMLRVRGEEVELDFTGSDPQLQSSLNVPTGGRPRHVLPTVGLVYVLYTLDPNLILNAGVLRVCRCIMPVGSILNPLPPAAVGMRSLTTSVIMQVTFGAFFQALPERLAASPAGGLSIMNVSTMTRDGQSVMASIGPVGGGAGAGPLRDGVEGSDGNMSYLRNTPVEIIEAEVPITVRRYGLAPDSGGPGTFRGGSGLVMEFQVYAPNTVVTARNRDRTRFAPWGVRGGGSGAPSRYTRNPDRADAVELGNSDIVRLEPGDVLRIQGPGAGGYGPPHERDADLVLRDVRSGLVSAAAADALYGVAIRDDAIDVATTRERRAAMASQAILPVDYGEGRRAFETRMTPGHYEALNEVLFAVPVNWRFYLKHRIFKDLLNETRQPGAPDEVIACFHRLRAEFPELRRYEL